MKKRTVIVAVSLAIVLAGSIAYASANTSRSRGHDDEPGLSPDEKNLEVEMIAALDDHTDAGKAQPSTAETAKAGTVQPESGKELSNTGQ